MILAYSKPKILSIYHHIPYSIKNCVASFYGFYHQVNGFGRAFREQLAEFQCHQHWSQEKLLEDQFTRLKSLFIYAETYVPYYRELFSSIGFNSQNMRSLNELREIPILDKETVWEKKDLLLSRAKIGKRIPTHTSGTTGKALHLKLSKEAYQRSYACAWFHYSRVGIQRGDRIATLAGHPVVPSEQLRPPFWVYNRAENELIFSSQHLTPTTLPFYTEALSRFRPMCVRGYPSSIYLVAMYLLETGRTDIRPKAVFTSSETLLDFQRIAIEKAFGCEVYSYYGNAERVAHILQCEEKNFHVLTETCVVEVLRKDGSPACPGEEGELICSGLLNKAMPLIRYRIGDTGILGKGNCPCGLPYPFLSAITGRVDDIVVTPDGRHVGRLDHVFKDALKVKEAQIIQEEVNSILVNIVPRDGFGPKDEQEIVKALRLRLGPTIGICIQQVQHIPRTRSGKFQFVISRVSNMTRMKRGRM